MRHDLSVRSAQHVLQALQEGLNKTVGIKDLVQPIPDSIEEQEKVLQEFYDTVGYTPAHLERSATRSHVQMTPSRMMTGTPSLSRSSLHATTSVCCYCI